MQIRSCRPDTVQRARPVLRFKGENNFVLAVAACTRPDIDPLVLAVLSRPLHLTLGFFRSAVRNHPLVNRLADQREYKQRISPFICRKATASGFVEVICRI